MARGLCAAAFALSMLFLPVSYSSAADLGRVATRWVCTERGAVAALQAFTKSKEAALEALRGDECRWAARPVALRVIAIGTGPVEDYEGDEAWVVEVGFDEPSEHRFTIAWPGINAQFAGQGA